MIDTIFFDYDGTLLPASTEDFTKAYFTLLTKKMVSMGFDKDIIVPSVWQGTKAMNANDGSRPNRDRFWPVFLEALGVHDDGLEEELNKFYKNEFNGVCELLHVKANRAPFFRVLREKGFEAVLATTPVFPNSATISRLSWIGLSGDDFIFTADYSNCNYCKPSLDYYHELFQKTGKNPEQCLMVGNSVKEDGCITVLGASFYLIDNIGTNDDTLHGSFEDFEKYVSTLPEL